MSRHPSYSYACGAVGGCSWTDPYPGRLTHPDIANPPPGWGLPRNPGAIAPRVHSALKSCFHFLLRPCATNDSLPRQRGLPTSQRCKVMDGTHIAASEETISI